MADAAVGRLTTHVLDTSLGKPAAGMGLRLYAIEGTGDGAGRREIATAATNEDGRCDQPLLAGEAFRPGIYEIVFEAGAYLRAAPGSVLSEPLFLDEIPIRFGMSEARHYHVPLLLALRLFNLSRQLMSLGDGPIRFLLNGEERSISGVKPTTTILEHLRRTERLTGTKEGCAEGDCGACTVLLSEPDGAGGLAKRAVNACIQFLPSLHGRAIETIEHLGRDGPHPLQTAMVERHGSQCGFCTPGFVMQLHAGWLNGALHDQEGKADRQGVKDAIAGNLCRCTGYGPIVDAGLDLARLPVPDTSAEDAATAGRLAALRGPGLFRYETAEGIWLSPADADELADTYAEHPQATLVAGATDVGLWVTKQHRDLPVLIDVSRVADLGLIEEGPGALFIGAGVTHTQAHGRLAEIHLDLGELVRRFAGRQIRNAGTIGGNIANGSPIGDMAPALIALGSNVYLRRGDVARVLPLEDFFLAYGRQDRAEAEFVAALEVPVLADNQIFACHKISKRFDSDISAVMSAFRLTIGDGVVTEARLAFGGMAATPKRAPRAEAALLGSPFDEAAARRAAEALAEDFAPLDDMRASASYRLTVAGNLIIRFAREAAGAPRARVLEIA